MVVPKQFITDLFVRVLVCPLDKSHREVFDSDLRGFYVDVMASGRKSFRVRYRFEKKLRVVTLGEAAFMSADEARQMAIEHIRKAKQGIDPQATKIEGLGPKIQDFFLNKYLPYVKSYKRSWDTDESMIRNHLVPKVGDKHMGSMSPPDIAVFLEVMKSQGYAPGTCNRALVLLRYGFELAIRWHTQDVIHNPVKEIKNLRDDNKIERFLSTEQAERLMTAVRQSESEMLPFIVMFLIYTGARKREVLDAQWKDVDWQQKSWRIPRTKSGKVRHVPLSEGAYELLLKLKGQAFEQLDSLTASDNKDGEQDELLNHAFIFANPKTGMAYNSFYYSWNAARCRAGLPEFRVHDLRHSFASFLVNAGRSLYEVQELLGHADIRTTSRYAHLDRQRLIQAVEFVPKLGM
jgi:integrase